jgi:hypothetical protein
MAETVWETIECFWCSQVRREAQRLEQRVYPHEVLPDVGRPYHVRARRCSLDVECNLAGANCCWAFANPNNDPFA